MQTGEVEGLKGQMAQMRLERSQEQDHLGPECHGKYLSSENFRFSLRQTWYSQWEYRWREEGGGGGEEEKEVEEEEEEKEERRHKPIINTKASTKR